MKINQKKKKIKEADQLRRERKIAQNQIKVKNQKTK